MEHSLSDLRINFMAHIRGDVFSRHLKDWPDAERHQASARFVAAKVTELIGERHSEEALTLWRNEALAMAFRDLPKLDRDLELARLIFKEEE